MLDLIDLGLQITTEIQTQQYKQFKSAYQFHDEQNSGNSLDA